MDGNFNNDKYIDNNNNSNYRYDQDPENNNNYIAISPQFLEKTSKWSGFLGVVTIISGVLTCLGAITTFGLSLIPGIINIILGLKLNKVKKATQAYLRGDSHAINETFDNIGDYFKIQGILMIAGFVLAVLGIMFFMVVGFSMFNSSGGNMYY